MKNDEILKGAVSEYMRPLDRTKKDIERLQAEMIEAAEEFNARCAEALSQIEKIRAQIIDAASDFHKKAVSIEAASKAVSNVLGTGSHDDTRSA